jgi:hypothetical protein
MNTADPIHGSTYWAIRVILDRNTRIKSLHASALNEAIAQDPDLLRVEPRAQFIAVERELSSTHTLLRQYRPVVESADMPLRLSQQRVLNDFTM